jgi:photosystem II stability/assembly factor-like uncharacterized protein
MIVPGPQLVWHPLTSTPMSELPFIDAGDGEIAYRCVAPGQGATVAHTFVTHDAGTTWIQEGNLPVGAQPPANSRGKYYALICGITVDETDPEIAVVGAGWELAGSSVPSSGFTDYATVDFGAHWQRLTMLAGSPLASWQGHIYALRQGSDPAGASSLWVSNDQLATWQPVGSALPASIEEFWLNPNNGELLAHSRGQSSGSDQFYASADGGKTWSELPLPQFDPHGANWVVEPPQAGQPWHICGLASPDFGDQLNMLSCTSDGGQTWQARPAPAVEQALPKELVVVPTTDFAIATDGALLVRTRDVQPHHTYRLPPSATDWQDLGPLPSVDADGSFYAPTSSGGILWGTTQQGVQVAKYPPRGGS